VCRPPPGWGSERRRAARRRGAGGGGPLAPADGGEGARAPLADANSRRGTRSGRPKARLEDYSSPAARVPGFRRAVAPAFRPRLPLRLVSRVSRGPACLPVSFAYTEARERYPRFTPEGSPTMERQQRGWRTRLALESLEERTVPSSALAVGPCSAAPRPAPAAAPAPAPAPAAGGAEHRGGVRRVTPSVTPSAADYSLDNCPSALDNSPSNPYQQPEARLRRGTTEPCCPGERGCQALRPRSVGPPGRPPGFPAPRRRPGRYPLPRRGTGRTSGPPREHLNSPPSDRYLTL
jgi:hypothetical protein